MTRLASEVKPILERRLILERASIGARWGTQPELTDRNWRCTFARAAARHDRWTVGSGPCRLSSRADGTRACPERLGHRPANARVLVCEGGPEGSIARGSWIWPRALAAA